MWAAALLPVLAAYANVFNVGFMWDDHVLIEQNTDLHSLQAPWIYLSRTFWEHPFLYGQQSFYRPLVTFTLALDWALGGGTPLVFHLTNLVMHLAVCTLIFVFALRRSRSTTTAAVVTMLFGVMPRLTESVTWIVGRTDVLATLLVLGAFLLAGARPVAARAFTGLCVLLALLAKEVALLGAAALLVEAALLFRRRERPARALVPEVVSTVLGVGVWWALRSRSEGNAIAFHEVRGFLSGVGHHVFLLLTPWRPMAQYGDHRDVQFWAVALGLAALGTVGFAGWRWVRSQQPWRAVWLAAAMGGVVLVSLVALPLYTIASDRFLYFPLALGAVVAAQRAWGRTALLLGLAATLGLSVVTWSRNELWADPLRFWQEVHDTASPSNVGAYAGLADALSEVSRFEEARALYLQAEQVRGPQRDSPSRLSLAVVESRLGHDAEALALLRRIIDENPEWRRAAYDLVLFEARALDFASARAALARARSRFGDDEVLRGFDQLLSEQETPATQGTALERARALHALGATRKAQGLYEGLLSAPETRVEAARWLVLFGTEAAARRGLDLLGDDVAARTTWTERFPTPG